MRNISQALIFIGLLLGAFALVGLYSIAKFDEFFGLDAEALVIDFGLGLFILALGLATMIALMIQDRVIEKAADRQAAIADGNPPQKDIPLCPSCLTPAELNQHFCIECCAPLTAHAEIDPLGQVYAIGDMYWKLTRGPSKPIAIIGLMVIAGPLPVFSLIGAIALLFALITGELNYLVRGSIDVQGIMWVLVIGLVLLAILSFYALLFAKVIRNRHHRGPRGISCFEYEQDGKEIESAAYGSGDRKYPPSAPTSLRENRGDM